MEKTTRPVKQDLPTVQEQQLKKFSGISPGIVLSCKTCFHAYLLKGNAIGPPVRACFYGPPVVQLIQNEIGPAVSQVPHTVSDDSFCHQWRKDVG
jgi:hypothetical protein